MHFLSKRMLNLDSVSILGTVYTCKSKETAPITYESTDWDVRALCELK